MTQAPITKDNTHIESSKTSDHSPDVTPYMVEVSLFGKQLVCIEHNSLSGKTDLTTEERKAIIAAAASLTAFIGDDDPEEDEWLDSIASDCTCCGECFQQQPCAGVMAGGVCDNACHCNLSDFL